eukprot:763130-Hanusia_phi.AAC.3
MTGTKYLLCPHTPTESDHPKGDKASTLAADAWSLWFCLALPHAAIPAQPCSLAFVHGLRMLYLDRDRALFLVVASPTSVSAA